MRLLIVSDMPHYQHEGRILGHGATVRELDHLARLFDEVVHVAFLHRGKPPPSALPYTGDIHLRGLEPAGGRSFWEKARVIKRLPSYLRVVKQELGRADAVHVRAPASVSLAAMVLLAFRRTPERRWIKYAGNWASYAGEPVAYRVQRWLLKRDVARSTVTINGTWSQQPPHVHTFLNPCLTSEELNAGRLAAAQKTPAPPVNLLFIGTLSYAKGALRVLEVLRHLHRQGVDAHATFVGGGPLHARIAAEAEDPELMDRVCLVGAIPRPELPAQLTRAHFVLLPSRTEGWPKVLTEGMAYGAIPIASAVGSIPEILGAAGVGVVAEACDVQGMVAGIQRYLHERDAWASEIERGLELATLYTYGSYLRAVAELPW